MYTNGTHRANSEDDLMGAYLKAAQLVPERTGLPQDGLSLLFPLEGRNGYVFFLAYLTKTKVRNEALYQVLTEQVQNLVAGFSKDANPQHRFEQFLGSLNDALAENVRKGAWNIPIGKFNALVGIAVEEQIYLSGTGEMTALFLHRQPSDRYQILNLSRSIQTEQTLPTWEKPLAVVLDGDLGEGDVFCLSNKELQREIPADELNSLLTTIPPNSAIEKIRQYYSLKDQVFVIVLKVGEKLVQMKEGYAKPLSDLSIDTMIDTEEETATLLEDRKPNPAKIAVWIFEKLLQRKMASRLLKDLRENQPNWKTLLFKLGQSSKATFKTTKHLVGKSTKLFGSLGKKETRKKIVETVSDVSEHLDNKTSELKKRITVVPRSTKFLIAGTLLAVVLLWVSVSWLSKSQAESKLLKAYNEQLAAIEDMSERAAGAVIYKDENQARSLYANAINLVNALPTATPEQTGKKATLLAEIDTAMNELRHMVTIPNPALVGDLSSTTSEVYGVALTKTTDQFYLFGSDAHLYSLNRDQKQFVKETAEPLGENSPILAASSENTLLYALQQTGVARFDTVSKTASTLTLTGATGWSDLLAYSNRLYVLEPSNPGEGQLYRYNRSGDAFTAPSKWIEAKSTELNGAVSFAIDGSVFILKQDGSIIKYVSGSEVGWKPGVVDPPLTQATDLWTDADSAYLYVLEPVTKRLIVYKKDTGEFLVQYRSDAFTSLTDFLVDEENYTIYLLSGSKLYSIAASHLK
jgi:hypothetical protein